MTLGNDPAWTPPTAEALADHLRRYRATPPSPWARRLPLLALLGLTVAALLTPVPGSWLLPWGGFVALAIYGTRQVAKVRRFEKRLDRARELLSLRHHRPALRSAWRLVPELTQHPALQHRAVAILGQALEELRAYDAAAAAFDRLLDDLPDDHPGSVALRLQQALGALFTQRLSDADDALRRLRGPVEASGAPPLAAAYRFALLFQAVQTAHYAEAIDEGDGLIEALRPLGVEAGYGHALMAWCYRQRNQPEADDDEQAQRWWRRATALLPAASLRHRFPDLRGLGGE
ncbi:MAG: hypothetical protein AAF710_03035 [Planctomycetota bacterium]